MVDVEEIVKKQKKPVKEKTQKTQKIISIDTVEKKIIELGENITSSTDKFKRHFLKQNNSSLCFLMDTKYGVGLRRKDGAKQTTFRIETESDLNMQITAIKGMMKQKEIPSP